MESIYTYGLFVLLLLLIAVPYWRRNIRARKAAETLRKSTSKAGLNEPVTLHPRIDISLCIGCGSCVRICPESVLGLVEGRAAIINGVRCIGHALCADVCPVGAIEMKFGRPREGMELPYYTDTLMTNVEGIYIAGELGGIGLIKNAISQGVRAVDDIVSRTTAHADGVPDIAIVGAGPAGIGAALAAHERKLSYLLLEQDDLGGSILHYPRQKMVLTSPVDLPLYGRLRFTEVGKEQLLDLLHTVVERYGIGLKTHQKITAVSRENDFFELRSEKDVFRARNVILALGRRGSPKKLGVSGEELPKVAYRLIEAERYSHNRILVVGGGDSAVEAAVALARQRGNTVTVSYRREAFVRLKEKNEHNVNGMMTGKKITVLFRSEVAKITNESVTVRCDGTDVEFPNDYVFIFAGGELPGEFLKKTGIRMRGADDAQAA